MSPSEQIHLVVRDRGHELDGVVRAGESWAAAARRTVASLHVDLVPVDLSGEVKHFQVDHDTVTTVRAMTPGDFPDVVRWLGADHVHQWWDEREPPDHARVREKYGPSVDGMTPTRMWVAEVNGRSIGFVQDYRIGDYPEFALLGPDPEAIGVDYAIGEPEWAGRGLGVAVLWAWMHRACRRFPDAETYFAAPSHRNARSLRMLAKAGFVEGLWFDEPQTDGSVDTVIGCSLDVARVIG